MNLTEMDLDIITGIKVSAYILFGFALILIVGAFSMMRNARNTRYFRRRKAQIEAGWRRIFFGIIVAAIGFLIFQFGEPVAVTFFPMTPTPSLTPTMATSPTPSLMPTETPSPTITETPSESHTPTQTPTPHLPVAIEAQFTSQVTPAEDIVFSDLTFSRSLSEDFSPLDPATSFTNPVEEIYAFFSYDGLTLGTQWTALWYRDGELVYYESFPWTDSTGGYGYTNWAPEDPAEWEPGYYQVQIFVGSKWIVVGGFDVEGIPPTATTSVTVTPTISETPLTTNTRTPWPTLTQTLSPTPWPTATPSTPTKSPTPYPTLTRTVTPTTWPTQTRTPTWVAPLTNIALNKNLSASNSLFSSPPHYAADNDIDTEWDSGKTPEQWIEIDLLDTYTISEIRLIVAQWPLGESEHEILVRANESSNFISVHTFVGLTKDGDLLIFVPDSPLENVRYIRIITSHSNDWVSWKEIIINGELMP